MIQINDDEKIPLTDAILEENGFELGIDDFAYQTICAKYCIDKENSLYLELYKDFDTWFYDEMISLIYTYELQMLFKLYGIDKNIEI